MSSLAAGGLPQLGGYLVTTPKDLADVLLVSDAADPLLARWQYGLGRAVAWTSDLRGRWSDAWIQWPGTAQLFSELVGWTIAPAQGPLRLSVRADAEDGHVTVDETDAGQHRRAGPRARGAAGRRAARARPGGHRARALRRAASRSTAPGTYIVRVDREGTGQPSAPPRLVCRCRTGRVPPGHRRHAAAGADRAAGGGHVLADPAGAFADDLAPISAPAAAAHPASDRGGPAADRDRHPQAASRRRTCSTGSATRAASMSVPWQPSEAT